MKRAIIILTLICAIIIEAQPKSGAFSPSVYYTKGSYSNSNSSDGFSLYTSLRVNTHDYIIGGFDNLVINNPEWEYDQKMFVLGGVKNLYPFYIKASFAHIIGDFSFIPFTYTYEDVTNIYSLDLLYNFNFFYVGASFSLLDLDGFISNVSKQYGLRFEWYPSQKFSFSVRPYFTNLYDGRKLYSSLFKLSYTPANKLTLMLTASLGERAYFFNSDLLTIFNQNETQTGLYKAKVEYKFSDKFKIVTSFQHSKFTDFNINYFSVGINLIDL